MLKEEMLELAAAASDPDARRAVLGDCLRASLLRSFHEAEAFLSVALVSEGEAGLEFTLLDKRDYKPERWLFATKRRLRFMGLDLFNVNCFSPEGSADKILDIIRRREVVHVFKRRSNQGSQALAEV